jgi:hypothetical protein
MKKTILILFVLSLFGFYSCKDDSAPIVILKGDDTMDHILNAEYEEPGFAAFDDEDGDITDKVIVDSLDVNVAGEVEIAYTVTDAEGNMGKAIRTITVYNQAASYEGSWAGEYIDPYTGIPGQEKVAYVDAISLSTTVNNGIVISDFAGNAGANISGTVKANTIVFPNQTIGGEAFVATQVTLEYQRFTVEYEIDGVRGVLTLAKQL